MSSKEQVRGITSGWSRRGGGEEEEEEEEKKKNHAYKKFS
jgi:hypothetical protein